MDTVGITLGKRALRFLVSVILSIIFLFSALATAGESEDKVVIPFTLEDHYIVVEAKVNDFPETFKLIYDTGSQGIWDSTILTRLNDDKLEVTGDPFHNQKVYYGDIDSIRIGNLKIENKEFRINPLSWEHIIPGINALIGTSFFGRPKLTIDYQGQTLTLSDDTLALHAGIDSLLIPIHPSTPVNLPSVNLTINDSLEIEAVIDTGSPETLILSTSFLDVLRKTSSVPIIKAKGTPFSDLRNSAPQAYLSRVDMKIGDYEFKNVLVYFYGNISVIGKNFLSAFKITFDFENDNMLLEPVEGAEIENNYHGYGYGAHFDNEDRFIIGCVWEGSPADEAGIEPGDEIIAYDSKPIKDYSKKELRARFDDEESTESILTVRDDNGDRSVVLSKVYLLPEL